MNNTWLNLQKQLPEQNIRIIKAVAQTAEKLKIQFFIVGATARDIIFNYAYNVEIYRETTDIDFAVAVENWQHYETLKFELIKTENFRQDKKIDHRLWFGQSEEEMKIDFVPFGELESPPGQIAFPPDGDFVMNMNGFREAFENAWLIKLTKQLTIRIVSPAGLVLLKFMAYQDKPHQRVRDLQDIWFILKNYLETVNDDKYYEDTDLMSDEDFDLRTIGARLLGRDLQSLLTIHTKAVILSLLSDNEKQGLNHLAEKIDFSENYFGEKLVEIIENLRQLKIGIDEDLSAKI
jgi:predicted nucleotidyltransferase